MLEMAKFLLGSDFIADQKVRLVPVEERHLVPRRRPVVGGAASELAVPVI
eukprot:CAMPEP_0206410030 /NCGR_PEP_ID=MMETSP0294-20121207/32308_1 /ASSEMBLY_ACC=CAM_ASM_000327 /TAXON_ID=39354 /ORGANISM="Heterosigma akashiwo, Strain CCMP2393" /LENGTH=49 /DNA_ID= /DNA_START= /DNA_END= /DNA_ORIENTATION=